MSGRQPLPIGTVLAGDVRIVSLVGDDVLGFIYGVETGAAKERAQLVEFCPRGLASRAPDSAVFASSTEAAELTKLCLERFVRDAETLRTSRHPNLQPVLAIFAANGTAYALQPPEQSKTLAAVANSLQRLPSDAEIEKIVRPLVAALVMLHARGLFHANITPETILVGSGIEPMLVRYGGTRAFAAARTRTVHSAVTPGYSAPELYLFDESGHGPLCDVFSLAAVLYRLVTGRTPADVIQRSLGEALAPASRTQGKYRASLLQAIDAGLSLDPKKRPQSMAAFGAMLLGEGAPAGVVAPAASGPAQPVERPSAPTPAAPPPPAKAEPAKPVAPPAPQPAASTPAKEPTKLAGEIAAPGGSTPAKPQLTVVPKPEVDERTLKPADGKGSRGARGGLLDMLPGSYRLVGLGVLLAAALATGMWQLDRQLKRDAKPPLPAATASNDGQAKQAASEPAAKSEPERKSAAAIETKKAAEAEAKKAADAELAARQQAEARASAERKEVEDRTAAERRAAEERVTAENQKADEAERERQQKAQQARAEEEARVAEVVRQQKARLAAVASATDRDIVLALRTDDTAVDGAIEQRLFALGYLNVVTSAGDKWLRPGDGEPFRDCDTCPEMVLVPPPVRVASAAAKPAANATMLNAGPAPQAGGRPAQPSAAFAVGRTEVTRDEFAAFVADTGYDTSGGCHARSPDWKLDPALSWSSPGFAQDGRHPVVCVSFLDGQAYAAWLAAHAKQPYRLPTEAEWEHAARSNTATALRFPFGNDEREICKYANGADDSAKQAFPGWQVAGCSDGFTHTAPAGTFKPNHFGLYDTMGNAWEWVDECAPPPDADGVVRKADCTATSPRILKGGSYSDRPELLEPQARTGAEPHIRDEIAGFRIMRPVEVRAAAATAAQK